MPPTLERVIEKGCLQVESIAGYSASLEKAIEVTALAAWNAALDAVREGIKTNRTRKNLADDECDEWYIDEKDITDHINSLGVKE